MSYFMTISGDRAKLADSYGQIRIINATKAQDYIKHLVLALEKLDGAPVWFVDDGYTGTSDDFVTDAKYPEREDSKIEDSLLGVILRQCFEKKLSFRIWLAVSNPAMDHITNTEPVFSFEEAIVVLARREGVYWHANNQVNKDASR
jgi:hypothetical protein